MSQPHPRQHHGTDMQFWQQQLMHKQLQELQRQQQRQQLDQGARQHNSFNQLSSVKKPVVMNQSAMMNEMATNNPPNCMWPNNLVMGLPPTPGGNSQMTGVGNMNWAQSAISPSVQNVANGLVVPDDHSQAMQSFGYINQQDQSLYGVPVLNTRGAVNQYPQLSRMSIDCDNLMTGAVDNQATTDSHKLNTFQNNHDFPARGLLQDRTSDTTQNLHGKGFFVNSLDILNSDDTPGNFQQANDMQSSVQDQAFHGMQEQDQIFWSGNSQERVAEQLGTSHGVTSLDPTEEKILYGNDDWGASFVGNLNSSSEGPLHRLPLGNDCFGGFPSLQSGSWSALMQEAVGSSTSDNGVQEEWNGLDFHKMEQSTLKPSAVPGESGKYSAWDDNDMLSASSLAPKHLSMFNSTDAGPNPSFAPTFQHSYQSTSRMQCHQGQKQLSEYVAQVQIPENSGMWMGQTYQQQNNFVDLENSQGNWTHQQNMMPPNVAMQSDNRPNGWNDSYAAEASGVNDSGFSTDGNIWRIAATHLNPNNRLGKPVESDVDTSQIQTDGSLINTYGSVMNSNSPKFNCETNRQVGSSQLIVSGKTFALDTCAKAKDDGNVGRNYTAPNERQRQSRELTINDTDEGGNYQHSKKQPEWVSGESYASNNSSHIQQSSFLSGEKGISAWSSFDQNPLHQDLKPSTQSAHQVAGSIMSRNQMTLGMNKEPFSAECHSHFQGMDTPIFQGSNADDQAHAKKLGFNGPDLSNHSMDARKRNLMGVEERCSRDDIYLHGSTSFGPSTVNCSQNKNITQTSQSMLDLHKVDHSMNCNTMDVSDKPVQSAVKAVSPQSSSQAFGLRLAPSPQRQLSQTVLYPQAYATSGKSRQNSAEAGDKDQSRSSYAPAIQSLIQNNASQRESLSNISEDRPKVASDLSGQCNSLSTSVSRITYPGNKWHPQFTSAKTLMLQQHKQRQNASSSAAHEVPHPYVNFLGNQTSFAGNASLPQQPHDSLDSGVPSSLSPVADVSEPSSLKVNLVERESMKKMIASSEQVHNSCSFPETKPGLQPSIAGPSQQTGFSRMLQNVWTNLSSQQRLAGLQPPKLTPQILQSIIHNNKDTRLGPSQKSNEGDKGGTTYDGTSYPDLELQGEQRSKISSLNQICSQVDASPKTGMMFQGHEVARMAASDGGSNISISSSVRLHQLDVGKVRSRQDVVPQPQTSNASTSIIVSSSVDGHTLMTSDVRQQNYSLLQQIQTMKGGDSERMILSGSLKRADYNSNPQTDWNTGQRFVSGQNSDFNVPVGGKVGLSSQCSLPSMDNNENNTRASTAAGGHDPQNQMNSLGPNSAGKSVRGIVNSQISPQMAPSWFKQYGSYRNGFQWNPSDSINHYLFQKVPRSMDCNTVVDPTSDSNHIDIHGHGSIPATIVTKELSSHSLFPSVSDQGVLQRSKKRKSETLKLISWHNVVTQGQQRIQSISTAELDWAQAANRLFEKVEDEAQNMEDNLLITQSRRRIILTSQMMQQLIPALPAKMFQHKADLAYENVTFCVAKAALTDACIMISCSEKDWGTSLEDERGTSKRFKSSVADHICSTLVDDYIGQSKKLENDFLRCYKRASILDVRLECQELEKFSIINRLGKFHGRPHTDPETGTRGMFIQRYVTAVPVPENLPEGIMYLSL